MINPENIYHVYPENDTKPHVIETTFPPIGEPYCECECNPSHKPQPVDIGEAMIIVHNSFDGREGVELAKEILNHKPGDGC